MNFLPLNVLENNKLSQRREKTNIFVRPSTWKCQMDRPAPNTWHSEPIQTDVILLEPLGKLPTEPALQPISNTFASYQSLFDAAETGNFEKVAEALQQGADANRKNWSGQTLLHEATENGHTQIVDALLRYGASPSAVGVEGRTPLHVACFKGHFQIASALINSGVDINAQDKNGDTALHAAASKGRAGIVALLMAQGPRLENRRNNRKKLAHEVCQQGGDCLKLLTGEIQDPILYSGQIFASLDNWDEHISIESDSEGSGSSCETDSGEDSEEPMDI